MNKTCVLMSVACAIFFAVALPSCKTTPPAVEENPPVASVAVKNSDEALTSLHDRMESRRKECLKYKLDSRLPADWSVAEAARSAGLEVFGKDYTTAEKSFTEALAKYEEILKVSFADIYIELDQEITAARERAVAVGADTYFPEQFAMADATAAKIPVMRENCEYTNAYDTSQLAVMRYNILEKCLVSVALRQEYDRSGLALLVPEDYAQAGAKYDEAVSLYGTSDPAALDAALASIALYKSVGSGEYIVRAEEAKAKADEIRSLADSIKASRSMTDSYASAAVKYSEGDVHAASRSWEAAASAYDASAAAFTSVYQNALLKRNKADAAIAAAKDKQASSTDLALKADALAPLPENAEGFSDDPLVIETDAATPDAQMPAVPEVSK